MTTSTTPPSTDDAIAAGADAVFKLDSGSQRVFVGLMLGMFVAAVSQTIVSPAMPRIVAELGGMEHYSWIATAAMLVSAIAVPIVGKLSDLYGRRRFYLGGLDLLPDRLDPRRHRPELLVPRLRARRPGRRDGHDHAAVPDHHRRHHPAPPAREVPGNDGRHLRRHVHRRAAARWIHHRPLGVALVVLRQRAGRRGRLRRVIHRFLKLAHTRRDAKVDVLGIIMLTGALIFLLLATSFGGTSYPWDSATIIGMYVAGAVLLAIFIVVETKAAEPVIPLRLFRQLDLHLCQCRKLRGLDDDVRSLHLHPGYAQGVLGVDATDSGLILMPMMVSMIGLSILSGLYITRTGRYKELVLVGPVLMGLGLWLLTRLGYDTTQLELTGAMIVFGLGLGMCMQVYTLVVQNVVDGATSALPPPRRSSSATSD